jgi:polyhydroxyalkanoate synthase subunit PhaC
VATAILVLLAVLAIAAVTVDVVWASARQPLVGLVSFPVMTTDGWKLWVHHRAPVQARFAEPIVLIHGLANNHRTMEFSPQQSLGVSLANAGFDVYSVDVRGCRGTVPPDPEWPPETTVDDTVRHDMPAVVAEVLRRSGASRVWVVGFSLGGLTALAMAEEGQPVAGVCTIGAPAYFSLPGWIRALLDLGVALTGLGPLRLDVGAALIAPLARVFPLSMLSPFANLKGLGGKEQSLLLAATIEAISGGVMRQMYGWVTRGDLASLDGRDWREGLREVKVPVLVIGGSVDGLATADSTRRLAALIPQASVLVVGRESGQSRDYGHGDLMGAPSAPDEVHRPIVEWLTARVPVR